MKKSALNKEMKETKDYFMRCCERVSDTLKNRESIKKLEDSISSNSNKDFRKDMMALRDRILIGNYIMEILDESI